MENIISKHFGLAENDVEAQALNEEVTASAATSVNNVPACEGKVGEQMTAGDRQLDIVVQDSVFRAKLHADMESKGAIRQERYTYKFSQLLAMGYIIATFVMNREVNEKHVKRLMKDVRSQGKKAFSQHVTMCSALCALLMGYDVIGLDGKLLTLETANLDKILVIIDGQHRVAACLGTKLDIDCDVMIVPCPEDIAQDIKDRNCCDKNWDTSALRHQIVEVEKKQDILAEYEKRAKEIYPGCSDKFYTTVLCGGKKDAVRRSKVACGELPYCDEEEAEMGLVILRSFRQLNPDCKKNASTTLKIVELVMEKMHKLANKAMTHMQFIDAFRVFASLNENACVTIEGAESFIANFSEDFDRFIGQHQKDVNEETLAAIDNKVHKIINAGPAKANKPQNGYLYEMIKRIMASEEVAAEKAKKKAEKDAIKAAKLRAEQKAIQSGKVVEKMALKANQRIDDSTEN